MSRRLVFEPEAQTDISEAIAWYESQEAGLGAGLLRALEEALAVIQHNPHQYQVIRRRRQVRRVILRPFPYALIYVASEHEVVVVACLHGRRSPRHWRSRLR